MRRPLSIMRANRTEGWIELLYKVHGHGLQRLADARPGERLSILAPIGNGFSLVQDRATPLLIGGGGGIGFLVQQNLNLLKYRDASVQMIAIAIVVSTLDFISAKVRERII